MSTRVKKRGMALLLSLLLLLGMMPGAVWAADGDVPAADDLTAAGYIVISFEVYDPAAKTVKLLSGPTKVGFSPEDTGETVAKTLLGEENVSLSGTFLNSVTVDGVKYDTAKGNELMGVSTASWSVYKNNAPDGVGIGEYKPADGDVYRVLLTAYDPADWSFPAMPHDLGILYWAMAESDGDLTEAKSFVEGDTPSQEDINAQAAQLSSAGGEHRILIDERTVLTDESTVPYTYIRTLTADKAAAGSGDTVTVTVTLPSGYGIKEGTLTANGTALTPVTGQEGKYTFIMPDTHVYVTAEFEVLSSARLDGAVFSYDESGTDVIPMSPAFNSDVTEYALTLYDYKLPKNTSKVYSNLTFGATVSASWQYYMVYSGSGFYTPGPNASQTVSGTAYGHRKTNVASPGMTNDQKHKVDVTASDGAPNTYYFRTTMLPTLSGLEIGGDPVEGFRPDRFAYSVTVPADAESVSLTASPYDEGSYYVYFDGGTQDDDISGTAVDVALNNSGATAIKLVVDDDNGVTSAYTVVVQREGEAGSDSAAAVMDAIAAKYAGDGIASYDSGSAPWMAADMAAYAMAFPDTENKLSGEQKQEYLDKLIPAAADATGAGDLAKYIIALRAMGYDASKVVTAGGDSVDLVKKLTDLVDAEDTAVTNVYTLPYVIIALRQGEGYATEAQLTYLKEKAMEIKDQWQALLWDSTDAAASMITALAPYCGEDAVKAEVDKAVKLLKDNQDAATGALNYEGMASASSTGLAITALAAMGEDPAEVVSGSGKNLMDGLMSTVNGTGDGFDNAFGTEQGFRGLVAAALRDKAGAAAQVYSFRALPMETARANAEKCPVKFSVVPEGAAVEVKLDGAVQSPKSANYYDLAAGSYTWTVSKAGYRSASGSFEVTEAEAAAHTKKDISVSLISEPSSGGEARMLTITVRVLTHDGDACQGKWTYKENSDKFTPIINTTVTVTAGQTVFDAFALAMEKEGVSYTEKTIGYITEIAGQKEFGHGSEKSGWQYMVGSTLPTVGCRDYALNSNATVTWYYTDDYTREKDADKLGGGSGGSGGSASAAPAEGTAVETTVTENSDGSVTAKAELEQSQVETLIKNGGSVTVKSDYADVTVSAGALKDGSGKTYSSFAVEVTKSAEGGEVRLDVKADGKTVDKVPGGVLASVAAEGGSAGNVLVLVAADGSETVVKKSAAGEGCVTALLDGSCTVKVADNSRSFDDTANHWAANAVAFVTSRELFQGVSETDFAPNEPMNRAMLAAVLYRLEDAPAHGAGSFSDVADGAWYADAVAWAAGKGIVQGSGGAFNPAGNVTREQLAAMLYRYAGTVGMNTSARGDMSAYTDRGEVSGWADEAMSWAVSAGLISGRPGGVLDPSGSATRAEVAVILERMVRLMLK